MSARITVDGNEVTLDEFWGALSERDAIALAKAAPSRIAGPWQPYSLGNPDEYRECRTCGCAMIGWVAKNVNRGTRGWWRYGIDGGAAVGQCATRDETKAAVDALRRADGWLLEDA